MFTKWRCKRKGHKNGVLYIKDNQFRIRCECGFIDKPFDMVGMIDQKQYERIVQDERQKGILAMRALLELTKENHAGHQSSVRSVENHKG